MKKFIEEKHDLLVSVFATIALFAIVFEITISGFSKEGIVAGIKDISGVLIDVLVLLVAASVFIKKKTTFKDKFKVAIETLSKEKYSPLLMEDNKEGCIRYNIASNSDALFTNTGKDYKRIFELSENNPMDIKFYINKSFFDKKGGTDFNVVDIANDIKSRLSKTFNNFEYSVSPNGSNYELKVAFDHAMVSEDDFNLLISLIDYTILLFVARNKS